MDSQCDPKKLLLNTLSEIRLIGGPSRSKSSQNLVELQYQSKTKDRFRNRVDSAQPKKSSKILHENDAKVRNEIEFLQGILGTIADKIDPEGEYNDVNYILESIIQEFVDEWSVVEEYERNKKLYRYLDSKWKKEQEEFKDKLLKCDEKIFDLENEVKEVEIENDIKLKLVTKWEYARREQAQGIFEEEIEGYRKKIEETEVSYEKEVRIYNEIETYTRNEIERLNQLASEWEARYTKECLELDKEIKTTKLKIERAQDKIQSLREIYIGRNIEIQSYLQQKAQMKEARRLEKQKWDSAVRIQAWWRGTMYRNGLGPYRRKKKAKKGKGGKK